MCHAPILAAEPVNYLLPNLEQVEGLDLSQPLSSSHQQLLHELWREHLLLIFRAGYLDPGSQERVLRYLPHDAKAIDERRFCNAYFQPRVPSNPVVSFLRR